jgi:Tfp pilus assembly protein PilX
MTMNGNSQRGATLVVGLVMLVVLTLLVLSAIRSGNVNMRIVGNMQVQEETATAAVRLTEEFISTNFTTNPASAAQNIGQNVPPDITAKGYTVSASAPTCVANRVVLNADIDTSNPDFASCISSGALKESGLYDMSKTAPVIGQSWCYQQEWEVRAQVTDPRTSAIAASRQGVALYVAAGTACPD